MSPQKGCRISEQHAQKVYGFSHLSVTPNEMTLRHLDTEGRVLHWFQKTADGKITLG